MSDADIVRLDLATSTLVLDCRNAVPSCIYWGGKLAAGENLAVFRDSLERPRSGGSLDVVAPLSLLPEALTGWRGKPGLEIPGLQNPGLQNPGLAPRFDHREALELIPGQSIEARIHDTANLLLLECRIEVLRGDVLSMWHRLTNLGDQPIRVLHLAAPVLPAPDDAIEMLDFAGRWCGEFQPQRIPWRVGAHVREGREGRTGHADFPAVIVPAPGASNSSGEVRAWHLAWHGGHRLIAEELADGRRQIQLAQATGSAGIVLPPGGSHKTPSLLAVRSDAGFNGMAHQWHACVRHDILRQESSGHPRPVHFNSWEAVYFRHDAGELAEIAAHAAELGAERFVLDDGWFLGRRDDRRALGDWRVDPKRYPQGLMPLIEHVHGLGMDFGLWVEPEMVSPDSELYRTHPDWLHGQAIELQPSGRHQYVLDLARPEVRDYIVEAVSALLRAYPIRYLKWDHNRSLIDAGIAQAKGLEDVLSRLCHGHPEVEIESCASGGGRIDYGILRWARRVWLSDSNDALERLRMQHEAALFLPPEITGSHIGPRRCHTSGRTHALRFRAWVAAQRHMGLELDPRELDEEEAHDLRGIINWWKANRDWLCAGRLFRLDAADRAIMAEMTLAADGERFVLFVGRLEASAQSSVRPLRLLGLDPQATYRLSQAHAVGPDRERQQPGAKPAPTIEGMRLSGSALMEAGIVLPMGAPESMQVVEGVRIGDHSSWPAAADHRS